MTDKPVRLTAAQMEMAKGIFTAAAAEAAAEAIAQRNGGFDYERLAEEAFKAAQAYSAVEKALRPPFNPGAAL